MPPARQQVPPVRQHNPPYTSPGPPRSPPCNAEETLCVSCVGPEDIPAGPAGAAGAAATAAAVASVNTEGGRRSSDGLQCSNCGAGHASKGKSGARGLGLAGRVRQHSRRARKTRRRVQQHAPHDVAQQAGGTSLSALPQPTGLVPLKEHCWYVQTTRLPVQAWWSVKTASRTAHGTTGSPGRSACGSSRLGRAADAGPPAGRQEGPAVLPRRPSARCRRAGVVLGRDWAPCSWSMPILSLDPASGMVNCRVPTHVERLHCVKDHGIVYPSQQEGLEPSLQPVTPANGRSARGAAPAAEPACGGAAVAETPLRRRREAQGIRAFRRLCGDAAGRQRRRVALAVLLRGAEESHRIKLEQQTANQLGGGGLPGSPRPRHPEHALR